MSSNARLPRIAVVVPFFQRKEGLLKKSLRSIADQTVEASLLAIVVDDGSPVPARREVEHAKEAFNLNIDLIEQDNGGAGSARNTALAAVPQDIDFVAFLDSDDTWLPGHLAKALQCLGDKYDAYFSDWWSFNFPETTNFQRIGSLDPSTSTPVEGASDAFELGVHPIRHILSDGGGVIQTSTVVYRFPKFRSLRFREEFYNGQDFFFWMDLGELGADFIYSTFVGCNNGEGINIYQGAGWGTDRSLQRIRNELFVWTSTERFYDLTEDLLTANRRTIGNLEEATIRDLIHRITHRKPIPYATVLDILRMSPSVFLKLFVVPVKVVKEKLTQIPTR